MLRRGLIHFFALLGAIIFMFPAQTLCLAHSVRNRRLHATPYGPSSGIPPLPSSVPVNELTESDFANRGGPPDVAGVWASDRYAGIVLPSGFVSTIYKPDSENEWMQQMGRYLAYSCTGLEDGQYIALATRRDTYSNGTIVTMKRCEVGQISLEKNGNGVYNWISSVVACPDPSSVKFAGQDYRVPDGGVPEVSEYTCLKDGSLKARNTGSGPGLTDLDLGSINMGSSLPYVLPLGADVPPIFSNPGGPSDITGIWSQAPNPEGIVSIELVSSDGFSYVSLWSDNKFETGIGKFLSYNTSGGDAGYTASISVFDTYQNGKTVSWYGCTTGKLDVQQDKYLWIPAQEDSCPDLEANAEDIVVMNRAFDSSVL